MLIDVRPILHIPGKELNFQFELDLSDMEFGGTESHQPACHCGGRGSEPGGSPSQSGADGSAPRLDAVCDRCGKAFLTGEGGFLRLYSGGRACRTRTDDEILLLEDGQGGRRRTGS